MRTFSSRSILWTLAIAFPWLVTGGAVCLMTRPESASTTVSRLDNLGLANLSPTIVAEIPQIRPQKINPMAAIAQQMQQAERQLQNGDIATAQGLYRKALAAAEREGHSALQATIHNHLGEIAAQMGQSKTANREFQTALDLGGGDRFVTSKALMGLAENAYQQGDFKTAKGLYARTLPNAQNIGDHPLVAQIESRLAAVNKALKPATIAATVKKQPKIALQIKPSLTVRHPNPVSQTIPPVQLLSNPQPPAVELRDPLADLLPIEAVETTTIETPPIDLETAPEPPPADRPSA
jgi:tetratricopeptide (TPR) repeat protein